MLTYDIPIQNNGLYAFTDLLLAGRHFDINFSFVRFVCQFVYLSGTPFLFRFVNTMQYNTKVYFVIETTGP